MPNQKIEKPEAIKTTTAPAENRNFRARLTYKSGGTQDLLIVAESTNELEVMRQAFLKYLGGSGLAYGTFRGTKFNIVVVWSEVASFHEWFDYK